jgi:hypothetical protein
MGKTHLLCVFTDNLFVLCYTEVWQRWRPALTPAPCRLLPVTTCCSYIISKEQVFHFTYFSHTANCCHLYRGRTMPRQSTLTVQAQCWVYM